MNEMRLMPTKQDPVQEKNEISQQEERIGYRANQTTLTIRGFRIVLGQYKNQKQLTSVELGTSVVERTNLH